MKSLVRVNSSCVRVKGTVLKPTHLTWLSREPIQQKLLVALVKAPQVNEDVAPSNRCQILLVLVTTMNPILSIDPHNNNVPSCVDVKKDTSLSKLVLSVNMFCFSSLLLSLLLLVLVLASKCIASMLPNLLGCCRIEEIRDKDNETGLKEGRGIEMSTRVLPLRDARFCIYLPFL